MKGMPDSIITIITQSILARVLFRAAASAFVADPCSVVEMEVDQLFLSFDAVATSQSFLTGQGEFKILQHVEPRLDSTTGLVTCPLFQTDIIVSDVRNQSS